MTRLRFSVRLSILLSIFALGLSAASAQTTGQSDVNAILQSLGLGGLITSQTGITPTTSQPSDGGSGGSGGGTGGETGRVPGIITDQFTTTSAGALQARRPGLYIQQAIAMQNGETNFTGEPPTDPPGFFKDTFDQIAGSVIDVFSNIFTAINTALGALNGSTGLGGGGSSTIIPIGNAVTTGQGTQTPIQ